MAKPKIKKNAVFLTARDMLNGYIAGNSVDNTIYNLTPLQMVPAKEKDEEWKKWNLDWFERAGLRQISRSSKKIIKNYHLANGQIDKSDYIISEQNDLSDMISTIANENSSNLPIKFFPIIPNVVNVLCGEFSKRDRRIIVKATDEQSKVEAYEYKKNLITDILVQRAMQQKQEALSKMGIDLDSEDPQVQQQVQQEMNTAKQLAEVEVKFKSYRGIAEQWANHMINVDNDRFNMYEIEGVAFRDMLISDREFWHIKVMEDDYNIELWEPWQTFYHKSPNVEYTSDGNYIGRIRMMSIPDVIDTYGHLMNEDQILSLKDQYRTINNFPLIPDSYSGDEKWYTDYNKPYPKSQTNVTWQKWLDGQAATALGGGIPSNNFVAMSWADIEKSGSNYEMDINGPGMVRVTESYWKSQKKVFELTWIKKDGTLVTDIVDENYKVTESPIYDTSLNKAKTKETLISGEHLEAIWMNETRWGAKINSSLSSTYTKNYSDIEPIYIGGDPTPFQFKGQDSIYGCKLPVEGKIFSERGSHSSSLVDKMKPDQIGFNIVKNQLFEFLADEVGNTLVLDQNMIPRNSLGGTWGQYNFPQFHQVMKDYQIAAIDPSIRNTESATNFSHFQVVDLSKTNQIMSRIQLAEHFKNEAFAVVGITPQRLGSIAASESATGTQAAVNNSYSQTEPYFDQHLNYLMPRVRQMMLDAAQFITATKPSSKLYYLNRDEENVFFEIEGYKLLLRDFKVLAKSTSDVKEMMNQLRQVAMQSTNGGGSLYEIASMLNLSSPSEIISKLKEADEKRQMQLQQQQEHEQQMQQQQQEFIQAQEEQATQNENYWKERMIQKDIYLGELKALGQGTAGQENVDPDGNGIPEVLEIQKFMHMQGMDAQDKLFKSQEVELKKQKLNQDYVAKQQELEDRRQERLSREKIEKMKLKNPVSGENKKK